MCNTKKILTFSLLIIFDMFFHDGLFAQIASRKVYGDGSTYCAFTSLIKKDGLFYLAFREAQTHVSEGDFGVIKILTSKDGDNWNFFQTISEPFVDMRDPNLSVSPQGNILLLWGARMKLQSGEYTTKTHYSKMRRGRFTEPKAIRLPDFVDDRCCAWCWRMTWGEQYGYTIVYRHDGTKQRTDLLRTKNGKLYKHVIEFDIPDTPSEGKVIMLDSQRMLAVVRTDKKGYFGQSTYPFRNWSWQQMPEFIGGHDICIEANTFVCASRRHTAQGNKTYVYYGSSEAATFDKSMSLPSGGDTGYCSVLKVENEWWISYYSAHESQKPSIYLAKIPEETLR